MTDNELMLALSDLLDKKLKPIKDDIKSLKLQNENDIHGVEQIEAMQADIDIMKKFWPRTAKSLKESAKTT